MSEKVYLLQAKTEIRHEQKERKAPNRKANRIIQWGNKLVGIFKQRLSSASDVSGIAKTTPNNHRT